MRTRPVTSLFVVALFFGGCDASSPQGRPDVGSHSPSPSGAAAARSTGANAGDAPLSKVDVGPAKVDAISMYTGGASEGDKVPLIVAIHGLGDRPDAFRGLFEGFPGRAHFLLAAGGLPYGQGFSWWPIVGTIDEKNIVSGLSAAADRLAGAIREWSRGPVVGKPIVTGFSQGGMLSFALAVRHADAIGEAIPVSGLEPPSFIPATWPAGTPAPRIVALHGEADQRVPFGLAASGVEKLRAAGVNVEWKTYPGVGHTISASMRRDLFAALNAAVDRAAAGSTGQR